MSFIKKIKNTLGHLLLTKEIAAHKKKSRMLAYEQVQHVGIVYNATYIEKEAMVHQYANKLRADGKKVFLLGYVEMKQLPGNKKFSLQSEYFWQETLSPLNLPVKSKISRFIEMEFDWLLNIYTEPILPMLAVAAYSHAHYRIGPAIHGGVRYFDAMIDTGENSSLAFLIEQMDFYLKVIK
jgi:hypothetical protein